MTPWHGILQFTVAWDEIAKELLAKNPWDFKRGSPKGIHKAIAQVETGMFFAGVAQDASRSGDVIDRETIAQDWCKGELATFNTAPEALEGDWETYLRRTRMAVLRRMKILVSWELFEEMAGDQSYKLTETGRAYMERLVK